MTNHSPEDYPPKEKMLSRVIWYLSFRFEPKEKEISEIKPPLFVTKYKNLAKKILDVHTVGERVVCLKMTSIAERAAVNKSLILRLM